MNQLLSQRILVEFLAKSKGEGARGGHVIGHTRSGKPIYSSSSHDHYGYGNFKASHQHFTSEDHQDASDAHKKVAAQKYGKHEDLAHDARMGGDPLTWSAESREGDKAAKAADQHAYFAANPHKMKLRGSAGGDAHRRDGSGYGRSDDDMDVSRRQLRAWSRSDFNKSQHGEGSRGGHIVGHTKSGKPIYGPSGHEHSTPFLPGEVRGRRHQVGGTRSGKRVFYSKHEPLTTDAGLAHYSYWRHQKGLMSHTSKTPIGDQYGHLDNHIVTAPELKELKDRSDERGMNFHRRFGHFNDTDHDDAAEAHIEIARNSNWSKGAEYRRRHSEMSAAHSAAAEALRSAASKTPT